MPDGIRFAIDRDMDELYLQAVENGDMETAQNMVNDAAEMAGFSNDDSWRMRHRAPNSRNVAEDPDGAAQKLTDWRKIVPQDYFEHPEYYINMDDPAEREAFFHVQKMLEAYERRKAEERQASGLKTVEEIIYRHRGGMVSSDLLDNLLRDTYAVINWYCQEHGMETPKEWRKQSDLLNSSDFRNWWETVGIF